MNINDFRTIKEYEKELNKPTVPNITTATPRQVESQTIDNDDYVDTFDYESYLMEWIIDNGHSLGEFLMSYISYAMSLDKTLTNIKLDPISVLEDWVDEQGFDGDKPMSYEEYAASDEEFDDTENGENCSELREKKFLSSEEAEIYETLRKCGYNTDDDFDL